MIARLSIAWLILAPLIACSEPDFDRASLVNTWRVLTVVAEPPVTGVDREVALAALVTNPDGAHMSPADGLRFEWVACLAPERVPGLTDNQYDPEVASRACGDAPSIPLVTAADGTAVMSVSSSALDMLLSPENLEMLADLFSLPPSYIEEVFERVGIPVYVQLTVCTPAPDEPSCAADGAVRHITAYKRVLVRNLDADGLGTNPPSPRFEIRDREADEGTGRFVIADPAASFRCVAEDGAPIELAVSAEHIIDPEDVVLEPGPGSWLEEYEVLDVTGAFATVQERAYYSFFATDGSMATEISRAPADEEVWTAPAEPGPRAIWVVMRDGHGGSSACRLDVDVI